MSPATQQFMSSSLAPGELHESFFDMANVTAGQDMPIVDHEELMAPNGAVDETVGAIYFNQGHDDDEPLFTPDAPVKASTAIMYDPEMIVGPMPTYALSLSSSSSNQSTPADSGHPAVASNVSSFEVVANGQAPTVPYMTLAHDFWGRANAQMRRPANFSNWGEITNKGKSAAF